MRPTQVEVAEQQIKEQTQQRLLGVLPNFRVSYRADAVPLNGRQKFKLAWKGIADPATIGATGILAGIQHARDDFSGFGRGPDGFAKRYAAAYGTAFTGTMISNALLPTLFKQDPRYLQRHGSRKSRVGYAVSRAVMRKADSGHWQPDYSRILGKPGGRRAVQPVLPGRGSPERAADVRERRDPHRRCGHGQPAAGISVQEADDAFGRGNSPPCPASSGSSAS